MRKALMGVGVFVAFIATGAATMLFHTKSFSPQKTAHIRKGETNIAIDYCSPFKREREIFGNLVQYGEIWRTGANETTIFTANRDIKVFGKTLKAGTYSLWSIPEKEKWTIIFNREHGQWGINVLSGKANYDPAQDVLRVEVPVYPSQKQFEQFTIQLESFKENIEMIFFWDNTMVVLPLAPV